MNLKIHPDFPSRYIDPRQVEVWLPPSYESTSDSDIGRYPVLYMHDGQNVFNDSTSSYGVGWGIDDAMNRLLTEQAIPELIIVASWCHPTKRWQEYMPQRPYPLTQTDPLDFNFEKLNGPLLADNYLHFLTSELKPFIDQTYRTKPEREHTTIMGSSMGGLISLYALCEYPDLFRAAGCVSTHWPAVADVIEPYLDAYLPEPGQHQLYFDFGTETLDVHYEPHQQKIDRLMAHKGYQNGRDWVTHKFPGADHSETAWRRRVHLPLTFLHPKT